MTSLILASLAVHASIAIVDVRIESGDGAVVDSGTVIVDTATGKIVAAGAGVAVPAGAERIEGKGKTLTPGLIATGSQLGIMEVSLERDTVDARLDGPAVPAFRAIDGFNPLSPRIPIDRAEGVTTTIATPWGSLLYGQGYAVETTAQLSSVAQAKRTAMYGGFGQNAKRGAGGARGGAVLMLRQIFDDVRFYKANKAAYDKAGARELSLPRVHLEAMIDVVDGKLPLVIDVNRASDILALLAFAQEQKLTRIMINGGAEAWLVAKELAAAKVPVFVQPSVQEPWSFEALRARDDSAAILRAAGVDVVITSGATDNGTTRLRQEAGVAVAYGMKREDALAAITATPARALGLADVGVVAAGRRANLVLWSGDPFETSTFAELVLIGGNKMSLDTRQLELVKRYRARR